MATNRYCDGVRRRDFLKAGVLTPFGLSLSLAGYFRMAEAGEVSDPNKASLPGFGKATSAVFVNLGGGPTHLDTFDMKPDAPAEYRGAFKPIETNVPGVA